MNPIALISVSDKRGVDEFSCRLVELGYEIVSSAGTASYLRKAGLEVTGVEEWTGFSECLDGRVKTLHPTLYSAILADRNNAEHIDELDRLGTQPIDLVAVNLYPFEDTIAETSATVDEAVEQIDIGGVALVRAAAKNFKGVTVVVDPGDYESVATALEEGALDESKRRQLATRAFSMTTTYDRRITEYLSDNDSEFGESKAVELQRLQTLRYGENPHQEAAWYTTTDEDGAAVEKLHGKELSYNNIVDLDAALQLLWEFEEPAATVIKHTNPTGCAVAEDIDTAFQHAWAGDPKSAFGGIVALNRQVTSSIAESLDEVFVEIVAGPDFEDEAVDLLTRKKNIRLITWDRAAIPATVARSTSLGWLMQTSDGRVQLDLDTCEVPTKASPTEETLADLSFAWRVVKHVKSNAIVVVKDRQVIGVGAGQTSRVDAVSIAIDKCIAAAPEGAVLASDAFFPFRDGPDRAAEAGVCAIVQPGGSIRDEEVIEACDEHSMAMVMTGMRHFRHG